MSAIPKSWKPSRPDGSSSLYRLIGDFVSQEIAFVRLIKVFVAIVHRGGVQFLDSPGPGGGRRRSGIGAKVVRPPT
jgi:hypothetical protein